MAQPICENFDSASAYMEILIKLQQPADQYPQSCLRKKIILQ